MPHDTQPAGHRGQPGPTNRLIHATSPYLLQHAHNPVDWYEWGPEALGRARSEDKPIFLSIGYSACHWCHVMERESFEDETVARVMNDHFVCIKVDREERPDLDDIYMAATQALTGSGGWPMSVWLTPELEPFYAGTYFPPEGRYGRPAFRDVLSYLAEFWREDRQKILRQAEALSNAVTQFIAVESSGDIPSHDLVVRAALQLANAFDPVKGGLPGGGTNKFPPSMAMDIMLRVHHHLRGTDEAARASAARLLSLVELTLERMAHGGIYDQLGGGIARYSTDVDWLVPHFEKMLYDQALVSDIYLKAYQLTGKPLYARAAGEILDYVVADLQDPDGGFYSTRDADSEGEEGRFYLWTKAELREVLGADAAELFCDYYDVSDSGNWEGRNILHVARPVETVARLHDMDAATVEAVLADARRRTFEARERRVKPHLDDKVLTSWNGLMIASMARGYRVLGQTRYRQAAERAAEFILNRMQPAGRLLRTYRAGKAHTPAFLDDYAFLVDGLLTLHEATLDERWLDQASRLNAQLIDLFGDGDNGGFFFVARDAETVLVRAKDANDGAIPSGNSVELMNLLRLSTLLDRDDLNAEAERLLRAFGGQLVLSPLRSERMLAGLDLYHRGPCKVVFSTGAADVGGLAALLKTGWQTYSPNSVFASRVGAEGQAAASVCRNRACLPPTSNPDDLRRQIGR
jgi:uncharacterized protein YyaL (SSP411 family)